MKGMWIAPGVWSGGGGYGLISYFLAEYFQGKFYQQIGLVLLLNAIN